jgi:hypothetical protein
MISFLLRQQIKIFDKIPGNIICTITDKLYRTFCLMWYFLSAFHHISHLNKLWWVNEVSERKFTRHIFWSDLQNLRCGLHNFIARFVNNFSTKSAGHFFLFSAHRKQCPVLSTVVTVLNLRPHRCCFISIQPWRNNGTPKEMTWEPQWQNRRLLWTRRHGNRVVHLW